MNLLEFEELFAVLVIALGAVAFAFLIAAAVADYRRLRDKQ